MNYYGYPIKTEIVLKCIANFSSKKRYLAVIFRDDLLLIDLDVYTGGFRNN